MLVAPSARTTAGGPGGHTDLQANRDKGDDTAGDAVVVQYNSVHASAAMRRSGFDKFDGSAGAAIVDGEISRGRIAGSSGGSPSRFALHSLTEQRLPDLGHRDGLPPSAERVTGAITWSTSGWRPTGAAADRAA